MPPCFASSRQSSICDTAFVSDAFGATPCGVLRFPVANSSIAMPLPVYYVRLAKCRMRPHASCHALACTAQLRVVPIAPRRVPQHLQRRLCTGLTLSVRIRHSQNLLCCWCSTLFPAIDRAFAEWRSTNGMCCPAPMHAACPGWWRRQPRQQPSCRSHVYLHGPLCDAAGNSS